MVQRMKSAIRSDRTVIFLFLLPALIPIALFWIYPMIETLRISATNWDYMSPQYDYVGMDNYLQLVSDTDFQKVLFNTLYFCLVTSAFAIVLGLCLAYLISGVKKFSGFFRSVLFLPWVTPAIAVSIVWVWIFNPDTGLANFLLSLAGIPKLPWIESSEWAMPAVIIVSVWKLCGYNMIFFLASIYRVPKQLFESAEIDGASSLKKFLHITLPYISPTTFFVIIVDLIDCMKAYDQILILTQGGPAGSTRTILYYFFQLAFTQFNMGQATATAVFLVMITTLLSGLNFVLSRKWVNY